MKTYFFIAGTIAILIVGIIFMTHKGGGDVVACTADALICPDGSAVGREGKECTFSACPNLPEFVGILKQRSTGYVLEVENTALPHTDTYAIPLEIRVSNALKDFENEKVRVTGSFIEGATLKVETLEKDGEDEGLLSVGETKNFDGLSLTFNELVQDSRCPMDAECIEAGAVTVNVTLSFEDVEETRNIASDEVPYTFEGFTIAIGDVLPELLSGQDISKEDYMVQFLVEKQ